MEISEKTIAGMALLIIALSSGATLYLQKTDDYINCRGEWILQEDGMYQCSKTNQTSYCYEIENRGSGWYRCYVGIPIIIEEEKENVLNKRVVCSFGGCKDDNN